MKCAKSGECCFHLTSGAETTKRNCCGCSNILEKNVTKLVVPKEGKPTSFSWRPEYSQVIGKELVFLDTSGAPFPCGQERGIQILFNQSFVMLSSFWVEYAKDQEIPGFQGYCNSCGGIRKHKILCPTTMMKTS